MSTEPTPPEKTPEGQVVHTFTVRRGMAGALVLETRDWYSGLLQAALARVRIEGQNWAGMAGAAGGRCRPRYSPCFLRGPQAARSSVRRSLSTTEGFGAARRR